MGAPSVSFGNYPGSSRIDTKFYPIVYLDKDYNKNSGFQELGFQYLKNKGSTKLDDYIDANLRNQELEIIQFNKDVILCFIIKKGKLDSKDKQGIIIAESEGIKIITDNNKSIQEKGKLRYNVSYSKMDYEERILIKVSAKDMLDLAYIKFYSNNKLCGRVQLGKTANKSYYAISMMQETNYRSNMVKTFTKEKFNVENSNGLGFNIDDLAKSLIKKSMLKPDSDNYVAQEQICFLALFSHGIEGKIFGDGKDINLNDIQTLQKSIDNGSLLFSKGGIIFLGACNAGTGLKTSFAQKLADVTNTNVYGMVNDGVAPVGKEGQNQMKYGPKMGNLYSGQFYKFTRGKEPFVIDKYIDILKLIKEAK